MVREKVVGDGAGPAAREPSAQGPGGGWLMLQGMQLETVPQTQGDIVIALLVFKLISEREGKER